MSWALLVILKGLQESEVSGKESQSISAIGDGMKKFH
jgi:hypothetical protein